MGRFLGETGGCEVGHWVNLQQLLLCKNADEGAELLFGGWKIVVVQEMRMSGRKYLIVWWMEI